MSQPGFMVAKDTGRKTFKLARVYDQLLELLMEGNYAVVACRAVGITDVSMYSYLKRGRRVEQDMMVRLAVPELPIDFLDDDEWEELRQWGVSQGWHDNDLLCLRFLKAQEQAKSAAIADNIAKIRAARDDSWQAAAWLLERTSPDLFRKRTQVDHGETAEDADAIAQGMLVPGAQDHLLAALAAQQESVTLDPGEIEEVTDRETVDAQAHPVGDA